MGRNKPHMAGGKKASANKKSKLVITFDSEKRKEYLTGFHKRKQERRRFGLDMEAYKQKKKLLEARKQRREEQKEMLAKLNIDDEDKQEEEEEEIDDSDDEDAPQAETNVMTFDDEHTQSKFGDVVTVTTSVGALESESEDNLSDFDDEEEEAELPPTKGKNNQPKEKQLTLFQRIQLKRKGLALPSKRAKLKQARESRKAMGAVVKKGGKKAVVGKRGAGKGDDDSGDKGKSDGKRGAGGKGMKKKFGGKRRKH